MDQPLHDQTAIVTGATGGIGRGIAVELARAGARVIVHGRCENAARETCRAIESFNVPTVVKTQDVTDQQTLESFVDDCWRWQGKVDIWINNAGADVLTGEATSWDFDRKLAELWQVDVLGTIRLSRLAGDRMQQAGGVIVNIGWDQAESGMEGESGQLFATTKGAVMAFTKSLAKSLAPQVRVNCVAPGWIRTSWGESASDYWQRRAVGESLLGRWGTPEDVARAVRYLVSPDAAFVTGQIIAVNGGRR